MTGVLIASLGEPSGPSAVAWQRAFPSVRFVAVKHPAPTGLRWGRRSLGLGVDAAHAALRVRGRSPVLATNPWVGAACRLAAARNVAVTGIYATPGTPSWRILRRALHSAPVIATSRIERDAWRADGGRADAVLWGGTFDLPAPRERGERARVFVGGTSDRDHDAVGAMVREVQRRDPPIELVIADGTGPRSWAGFSGSIQWLPFVQQAAFLAELVASDVSWLPLRETGRAAGHMVLAASLQAGVPVLLSPTKAMSEYLSVLVGVTCTAPATIDGLLTLARLDRRKEAEQAWRNHLSIEAYVAAVAEALDDLGWPHRSAPASTRMALGPGVASRTEGL